MPPTTQRVPVWETSDEIQGHPDRRSLRRQGLRQANDREDSPGIAVWWLGCCKCRDRQEDQDSLPAETSRTRLAARRVSLLNELRSRTMNATKTRRTKNGCREKFCGG